jgi:hypothetical protein
VTGQNDKELEAKRELIKAQPTLDAKQPHSRAAMKVFERLDRLYKESNEIFLPAHWLDGRRSDPVARYA